MQIKLENLSQGELIAVINYISQMLLAIIVFSNLITIYTRAFTSAKRVKSVLDVKIDENEGNLEQMYNGNIEMKDVVFSYDSIPLLNNFSISVNEGEIFGIIGRAGSGKSTILNLINRSYDIQSGSILIGNKDIKEYNKTFIKDKILLIPQKIHFFRETIKENIILGRENITDDDIIRALKNANAWEFVSKLPNGINTKLENNANNFSGGQKQRIGIARCFAQNPKILLLDDITSALDKKTEREVFDNIYKYVKKNKITTIISSQKLSAFRYADRILVINDGKVEMVGSKEQLEKFSKTYREIQNLQLDNK
ncbi:MAG: ABC transporter ATP-binding protein [Clostridia bacterium]|nr:ABC transporter ATP-binding protein [Clostridia bacterium]